MKRYILLLGGNLADPESALNTATSYISSEIGRIVAASSRLWTAPCGKGLTGDFLNQALMVESSLAPEELLDAVESIERKMGRSKPSDTSWNVDDRIFEDRIIDIDIAYADFSAKGRFDGEWHSDRLSIPHKAVETRSFIKQLVNEIM